MSTMTRTIDDIARELRIVTDQYRDLEERYQEQRKRIRQQLEELENHYKPDLEWLERHMEDLRVELLKELAQHGYDPQLLPKGMGLRWIHRVRITDEQALPREYLIPDTKRINDEFRRQGADLWELPGTEVEEVPVLMVYRSH